MCIELQEKNGSRLLFYGEHGDQMQVSYWVAPGAVGKVYEGGGVARTPEVLCQWPAWPRAGFGGVSSSKNRKLLLVLKFR